MPFVTGNQNRDLPKYFKAEQKIQSCYSATFSAYMAERCISQSNSSKLRELVCFGPLVSATGFSPSWTRLRSFNCSHATNKRSICIECKWKHTVVYFTSLFLNQLNLWFKISKNKPSTTAAQQIHNVTLYFEQQLGPEKKKVMWLQTHLTGSHLKTVPARFPHLYRTFQPSRTPPSAAL